MIPIYPVGFPDINQNVDTEVIFESITEPNKGERWKRTGYCSRCGNCCDDPDNYFKDFDGNYEPGGLEQVVPGKCAYFRWDDSGLALCTGRETLYYKSGCNVSPSKIQHIIDWPDCTYKFEKIKDAD